MTHNSIPKTDRSRWNSARIFHFTFGVPVDIGHGKCSGCGVENAKVVFEKSCSPHFNKDIFCAHCGYLLQNSSMGFGLPVPVERRREIAKKLLVKLSECVDTPPIGKYLIKPALSEQDCWEIWQMSLKYGVVSMKEVAA